MFVKVTKPQGWNNKLDVDSEQLWSEIKEGNKEAVSKLFCVYYSQLYNYGIKMVSRRDFVKDCIQELFLTIWNKRKTINEAYSVKSYLLYSLRRIILRNLTKQRNRKKRNQVYADDFFEEPYNIEELMVHFETENEQKDKLKKAINSLSKRQTEAIYLKFYDGLNNDEIAYVMNINRQSVYNHISEAISKIQTLVEVGNVHQT